MYVYVSIHIYYICTHIYINPSWGVGCEGCGGYVQVSSERREKTTLRIPVTLSLFFIILNEHWAGPSIRPICTRYWFTMTYMIQVCSNFH